MQLAAPSSTPRSWITSRPLPLGLPTPAAVSELANVPRYFGGSVGERGKLGIDRFMIGVHEDGWVTHGSFEAAVAAARELSRALPGMGSLEPQRGTIAVMEGRTGWLLLRAGTVRAHLREYNYELDRETATPATARQSLRLLRALVSPTRWVDFR
jgi:hypothetical protein